MSCTKVIPCSPSPVRRSSLQSAHGLNSRHESSSVVIASETGPLSATEDSLSSSIDSPRSLSWADMMDEEEEDAFDIPWETKASHIKSDAQISYTKGSSLATSEQAPIELLSCAKSQAEEELKSKDVAVQDVSVDISSAAYLCTARVAIIEELAEYQDATHDAKIWAIRHPQKTFEARAEVPPIRRQCAALRGKAYWTDADDEAVPLFPSEPLSSIETGSIHERSTSWADMEDDDEYDFDIPWLKKAEQTEGERQPSTDDLHEQNATLAPLSLLPIAFPQLNSTPFLACADEFDFDEETDMPDCLGDSLEAQNAGSRQDERLAERPQTEKQSSTLSVNVMDEEHEGAELNMPDWGHPTEKGQKDAVSEKCLPSYAHASLFASRWRLCQQMQHQGALQITLCH